jgi:hypothetical protein
MPQLEVLRPRPDLKEAPGLLFLRPRAHAGDGRLVFPSPEHIAVIPDALRCPGGTMPLEL